MLQIVSSVIIFLLSRMSDTVKNAKAGIKFLPSHYFRHYNKTICSKCRNDGMS